MAQRQELEEAIAALEVQRALLGDSVVDASQAALREQLAALEPTSPGDEQRKLVTVLFADLVGFTSLSEHLDPEEVRAVQDAYFAAVTPPIHEHGGRVEKYIGDAILAVFGVPEARESDPLQAVRAALAMQRALADAQVPGTGDEGVARALRLRVGINTGLVLARLGRDAGDFVVTGDAVNLAARLQTAAPPGGVLISHASYRHIQGLFDVEAQEPLAVKGKAEPVQTYLVLGARPPAFFTTTRGVEGIATRLIGREGELQLLQDALLTAVEEDELQVVTVVGDAGVGKSRLLREFVLAVEGGLEPLGPALLSQAHMPLLLFSGRATQAAQRQPLSLLRDLFARRFDISDGDNATTARAKLEQGVTDILRGTVVVSGARSPGGPLPRADRVPSRAYHPYSPDQAQMQAHFLGHWLGYDFGASPYLQQARSNPQQVHDRGRLYLSEFFLAAASQGAVLMLLEDLHWADDSSLDALSWLLARMAQRPVGDAPGQAGPVCVVAAGRPSLLRRRPHWGEGQAFHTRLDLQPLTRRASRQLVAEILRKVDRVPDELTYLVVGGAEGNPYYVEELVKMLVEEGVIVKDEPHWCVNLARLQAATVPPTLMGVLQARLDRLPGEERSVLQQASVVGNLFWDRAVQHLRIHQLASPDQDRVGVTGTLRVVLDDLRAREMVFQREVSAFADANEYLFKHALLRDVAYESVLRRLRQVYHGLVAHWLIQRSRDRATEFAGLIADHLELAGRVQDAIPHLELAGQQAAAQYANQEAIAYYRRALDQLQPAQPASLTAEGSDEALAARLLEAVGDLYELGGRGDLAWDAFQQAGQVAPLGDRIRRARLHRKAGEMTRFVRGSSESMAELESAVATLGPQPAEASHDWWQEWLRIQFAVLWHHYWHLEPESFEDVASMVGPVVEAQGTLHQKRTFLNIVNAGSMQRCRYAVDDTHVARARQELALGQELGDWQDMAASHFSVGFTLLWRGSYQEAITELTSGLALAEAVGSTWVQTQCLTYQAVAHRFTGGASAVHALATRALHLATEGGYSNYIAAAEANLGWWFWHQGDIPRAEELLLQAVRRSPGLFPPTRWLALCPLAAVTLAQGRVEEAVNSARQMLEPSHMQLPAPIVQALEQMATAWDAAGKDAAATSLTAALELAKAHGYL